jgi:hypothetical protein
MKCGERAAGSRWGGRLRTEVSFEGSRTGRLRRGQTSSFNPFKQPKPRTTGGNDLPQGSGLPFFPGCAAATLGCGVKPLRGSWARAANSPALGRSAKGSVRTRDGQPAWSGHLILVTGYLTHWARELNESGHGTELCWSTKTQGISRYSGELANSPRVVARTARAGGDYTDEASSPTRNLRGNLARSVKLCSGNGQWDVVRSENTGVATGDDRIPKS